MVSELFEGDGCAIVTAGVVLFVVLANEATEVVLQEIVNVVLGPLFVAVVGLVVQDGAGFVGFGIVAVGSVVAVVVELTEFDQVNHYYLVRFP